MGLALFFSLLFFVFALAMLVSGFWEQESLSPGWQRAKAYGFVVIAIGGVLGLTGALGDDVDGETGAIWLGVSVFGLATYGAALKPGYAPDRAETPGQSKSIDEVPVSRWEHRGWAVWVPAAVTVAVMAAGVVYVLSTT